MDFVEFRTAVQKRMDEMVKNPLFITDLPKDALWETYLEAFPEGTNPMFRERTEHDCQCCKQFIRSAGSVVTIKNGELVSIWDIEVGGPYQIVADALAQAVKSRPIVDSYLHSQQALGAERNFDTHSGQPWNHFYYCLPASHTRRANRFAILGHRRTDYEVLRRSLTEITPDAVEVVKELIDQNSLYRGAEHLPAIKLLIRLQKGFRKAKDKDLFCWAASAEHGYHGRIRNTVIGTLLVDLSDGVDLDQAVRSFEQKVAPINYKRPTALVTKGMIEQARKKVEELGLEDALPRRYARVDDITVNNVLFADRSSKQSMGVFEEMADEASVDPASFKKVEEIPVDKFMRDVLPRASGLELMVENRHINNMMSLIAPVNPDAPNILRWNNNFSWTYHGDVTDSIKERVKRAGGNVNGVLRASLSWFNYDDLDLHVREPSGSHIYFSHRRSCVSDGTLDVDMNAGGAKSRTPVENVIWTDERKLKHGKYQIFVHNYRKRETTDVGFTMELEYEGKIYTFHHPEAVRDNHNVVVCVFDLDADGIKFTSHIDMTDRSRVEWGVATQTFTPVKMVMRSPNYWDEQKIGNKHWFFLLNGCIQDGKARGLYNEFLKPHLNEHRKVFEVLGGKLKAEESEDQLSGVGFSSTKRDNVLCKVKGKFNRVVRIVF